MKNEVVMEVEEHMDTLEYCVFVSCFTLDFGSYIAYYGSEEMQMTLGVHLTPCDRSRQCKE